MAIIGHGFVGKAVDAGFNDPRIEKYIISVMANEYSLWILSKR